jgi:hypothetical protein
VDTLVSRASRAGSSTSYSERRRQARKSEIGGTSMPRGRATFNKRQKEQARQQKQRDKAERKSLRKLEKQSASPDEMREMREHAAAQAALFNIGVEETETAEESMPDDRPGE